MRVSFLLQGAGRILLGGSRVVYEYARGLSDRGHEVTIIHAPQTMPCHCPPWWRVKKVIHFTARSLGFRGGYKPPAEQFSCPPHLKILWRPSLHPRWLPEAEALVVINWETAEWALLSQETRGRKFFLMQALETCFEGVDEARVLATYRAPFYRIVVSRWLQEYMQRLELEADYVPNGLNFEDFGIDVPPAQRDPRQVFMLYNFQTCKGFETGLKAVQIARDTLPDLKVAMFGWFPRPDVPDWIIYHRNPPRAKLRDLYNQAAVFLSSSRVEGWGLTPCEAAQCGAALCVTDIGGHREFAIHDQTALLSAAGDAPAMAQNLIRLIQQPELRLRLADNANRFIQQFTWSKAVEKLETILLAECSK